MKRIISSLIVSSLVLVVSASTSFAQQVQERTKAELHETKTEKVQVEVKRALQKDDLHKKSKLKAKPVKARAKINAKPARVKIIRKK